MCLVRLTVTESRCRSGCCKAGDTYLVEDICPPLCHELWHTLYPMVYALLSGASLEYANTRARSSQPGGRGNWTVPGRPLSTMEAVRPP